MLLVNFISDNYPLCDFDLGYKLLCYEDSTMSLYQADTLSCNYTTVGVEEIKVSQLFKVYPIPANDILNLESGFQNETLPVKITDLLGNEIMDEKLKAQNGKTQFK